jgi:hypothetical protein
MKYTAAAVTLLEKALWETGRVEVLGVCDRAHLNKTVSYIEEALKELSKQGGFDEQNKEAV